MLKIEDLRKIGKKVLDGISGIRQSPEGRTALGIGAAGDKSYPIDRKAEEIIISGLSELGEHLTVISEEAGIINIKGGGDLNVIIDPIDGSKNAISGIPLFSTSIAAGLGESLDDITVSYILNLVTGDEFWAEKNSGAYCNGEKIHTQEGNQILLTLYETQAPGRNLPRIMPLLSGSAKIRCLGSTALDMAYLSSGAASIFVSPSQSRSFDFGGGWLLIKEAGGIVTNISGEDIGGVSLGLNRSSTLLAAANQELHRKALGLLSKSH